MPDIDLTILLEFCNVDGFGAGYGLLKILHGRSSKSILIMYLWVKISGMLDRYYRLDECNIC